MDVRFHPDAEGVAVVGHDVIEEGPEHIAEDHRRHDDEEHPVHLPREHIVEGAAGDQREGQVDRRDQHGAEHVDREKLLVVSEIAQKDRDGRLALVIFCGHMVKPPFLPPLYTLFRRLQAQLSGDEKGLPRGSPLRLSKNIS